MVYDPHGAGAPSATPTDNGPHAAAQAHWGASRQNGNQPAAAAAREGGAPLARAGARPAVAWVAYFMTAGERPPGRFAGACVPGTAFRRKLAGNPTAAATAALARSENTAPPPSCRGAREGRGPAQRGQRLTGGGGASVPAAPQGGAVAQRSARVHPPGRRRQRPRDQCAPPPPPSNGPAPPRRARGKGARMQPWPPPRPPLPEVNPRPKQACTTKAQPGSANVVLSAAAGSGARAPPRIVIASRPKRGPKKGAAPRSAGRAP
jgi:hypothetical protein